MRGLHTTSPSAANSQVSGTDQSVVFYLSKRPLHGPCVLPDHISQVNYMTVGSTDLTVALNCGAVVIRSGNHDQTVWGNTTHQDDPHLMLELYGLNDDELRVHLYLYSNLAYKDHSTLIWRASSFVFAPELSSHNY
jgi:hypothetical protein